MANLWILNQYNKGNKSRNTDAIVTDFNNLSCVRIIHNCLKCHKIRLNGCLVVTQFVEFKAIQMQ